MVEKGFFLCVDKPAGMTSHDVVARMRYFLKTRKIGHTGTLDPFATGVLVLAVGPATRLIQYLPEAPKCYQFHLQLGVETETADCDGDIVSEKTVPLLSQQRIEEVRQRYLGQIEQKPPIYSAIKVKGRRLYEYARAGIPVEIPSRTVDIHSLELQQQAETLLSGELWCSKGTYVRSLGVDIAKDLDTVGYLSSLRRTASDGFSIAQSLSMADLSQIVAGTSLWKEALARGAEKDYPRAEQSKITSEICNRAVSIEEAFHHLHNIEVSSMIANKIAVGISPSLSLPYEEDTRLALKQDGKLLAIAKKTGNVARLLRVIAKPSINDQAN